MTNKPIAAIMACMTMNWNKLYIPNYPLQENPLLIKLTRWKNLTIYMHCTYINFILSAVLEVVINTQNWVFIGRCDVCVRVLTC